jgi:hypothetical protein
MSAALRHRRALLLAACLVCRVQQLGVASAAWPVRHVAGGHGARRGDMRGAARALGGAASRARGPPRVDSEEHAAGAVLDWTGPFPASREDLNLRPAEEAEEGARRQQIESLRQLLQGGDETLDKALAREDQQHEEEEERKRVLAERDKRKRQRAEEVAFLRSVAIRDAQGTFEDPPRQPGAHGVDSGAQCSEQNGGDSSGRRRASLAPREVVTGAKRTWESEDTSIRHEDVSEELEVQAGVGADATDSIAEFGHVGSSLAAQASLHAQQAVQRALERLQQEPDLDSHETSRRADLTASGRGDDGHGSGRPGTHMTDEMKRQRIRRREGRQERLRRALQDGKDALRKGMIEAGMQAVRAEGDKRREHEAQTGAAHAALVRAVAGPGARGTIAEMAGQEVRAALGKEGEGLALWELREEVGMGDWRMEDGEAVAAARMRRVRPVTATLDPCARMQWAQDGDHLHHDEGGDFDEEKERARQRAPGVWARGEKESTPAAPETAATDTREGARLRAHCSLKGFVEGPQARERRGIGVTVEFFSDPGCPWSYVARQQLENALDDVRRSRHAVDVQVTVVVTVVV